MRLLNISSRRPMYSLLVSTSTLVIASLLFPLSTPIVGWHAILTADESDGSPSSNVQSKFIGDYRKDVKAFVKRSKVKKDPTARIGAIVDLCMLHDELVNDSRFASNYQLQGFRAIAAERLKKCRKEIQLEIKRYRRQHGLDPDETPGGNQSDSPGEVGSRPDELLDPHQLDAWMIEDMQSLTQITGGPVRLWNYTGIASHGPGICDYGPELVRMIETTINPDFWRRNGGTGIIEYYQPLRILVVSASTQVHENMADLLRTLRRNQ